MRASNAIRGPVASLLDVGCNVGAWLADCHRAHPSARLAGVDINEEALGRARANVPDAVLARASAERLPFPDRSFDHVTCIEVLEHVPAALRPPAVAEMRRVLRPGGRLVLTVPHAGLFAWLDSNNVRLRLPGLYRAVVGIGGRDAAYSAIGRHVEWHEHFTLEELLAVVGTGWRLVAVRRGGLLLYPMMDWLSWPFYRLGLVQSPARRLLERVAIWDYDIDFGRASYGILLVLERVEDHEPPGRPE